MQRGTKFLNWLDEHTPSDVQDDPVGGAEPVSVTQAYDAAVLALDKVLRQWVKTKVNVTGIPDDTVSRAQIMMSIRGWIAMAAEITGEDLSGALDEVPIPLLNSRIEGMLLALDAVTWDAGSGVFRGMELP